MAALQSFASANAILPYRSFLDLRPDPRPERGHLNTEIRWHDPSVRNTEYDAAVIGCGPSGLRLAERASRLGLRICCVDPSPLSPWSNNYGVWADEMSPLGLGSFLDRTWPSASIILDDRTTKLLPRPYARIDRTALKQNLLRHCSSSSVAFHAAKAWGVTSHGLYSTVDCSDGSSIRATLVVDATGHAHSFVDLQGSKTKTTGYQIAHGILAEVDGHPFDLDSMVLMDWRDSHLGNEPYLRANNSRSPTFLYVMPLDNHLVFLEETSLVSRPAIPYGEVKLRMAARVRHLGIKVKRVIEDEKCVIPMGGPMPVIPQSITSTGAAARLVHPSTGYMMAQSMAAAESLAEVMAECLGSSRMVRGRQLYSRIWSSMWPEDRRRSRAFYQFGMETLLKLDLKSTREFFNAFFQLDPYYWEGFLSNRLSLSELAVLSLSLFKHASNRSRLDILTHCPAPLGRMIIELLSLQSTV